MPKHWPGGLAAAVVTLVTAALVILDITDSTFGGWWAQRALTTSTVSGILVLLITVLVVDQVVRRRQLKDRSQATAAQAAILLTQALRATGAVSASVEGSGERETAADEVRTYMTMLVVGAPVLIDGAVSRAFLEQAQRLGGQLARTLAAGDSASDHETGSDGPTSASQQLDDAAGQLRDAAAPLLLLLSAQQRRAAGADDG